MKQIKFIGVMIIITVMTACGKSKQGSTQNDVPEGWKILERSDFSIQYPNDFELDLSGQMGMSFMILSPQTSPSDMFRENVNLIIQDLRGHNISFDDYVEISKNQIETFVTDGSLVESKRTKTDDFELHTIIYTGKQGMFDLKWLQYYIFKNQTVYLLTFTAEAEQFDNYIDVARKIMDSFQIK